MATEILLRQVPRDKLFAIFKSPELVKLFEDILRGLGELVPADLTALEAAVAASQVDTDAHIADAIGAHAASAISNIPAGAVSSTTVQGAINELDAEKQPIDATLTALAALTGAADRVPYFTATETAALAVLTAYARTLLAAVDEPAARVALGLGSIATQDAGNVAISGGAIGLAAGSLGYAAGNGGAVTQTVSKSAGVTLNKPSGEITMDAAALAADTAVTFTLTNSRIAAGDRIIINHVAGGTFGAYACDARAAAGSAEIMLRNLTAGSLSEAVVLGFAVVKGATS